ncbi:MAG: hypothetical protein ACTSPD_10405 [Promethearchaeota archaeon]
MARLLKQAQLKKLVHKLIDDNIDNLKEVYQTMLGKDDEEITDSRKGIKGFKLTMIFRYKKGDKK